VISHAAGAVEEAGRDGLGGLGIHQREMIRVLDDQVGLDGVAVAVERQAGSFAAVGPVLEDFGDDPCLEDRAAQRVRAELVGAADAEV